MKIKHLYYVLSLLVAMSMVLAACAPQVAATTEAPGQTAAPGATEAAHRGSDGSTDRGANDGTAWRLAG